MAGLDEGQERRGARAALGEDGDAQPGGPVLIKADKQPRAHDGANGKVNGLGLSLVEPAAFETNAHDPGQLAKLWLVGWFRGPSHGGSRRQACGRQDWRFSVRLLSLMSKEILNTRRAVLRWRVVT